MVKLSIIFGVIIVLLVLIFGFVFFEPFLTESEEVITVINKERWIGEKGSYFIFTEKEVFLNKNDYYHNKENADVLYPLFKEGFTYKVKVVGVYLPFLPRFRNIINIIEKQETNFPLKRNIER
jgi:hypothetical protein